MRWKSIDGDNSEKFEQDSDCCHLLKMPSAGIVFLFKVSFALARSGVVKVGREELSTL